MCPICGGDDPSCLYGDGFLEDEVSMETRAAA